MIIGRLLKANGKSLGHLFKCRALSAVPKSTDPNADVNVDGVKFTRAPKDYLKASGDGSYRRVPPPVNIVSGSGCVIRNDESDPIIFEYVRNPPRYKEFRTEGSSVVSSLRMLIKLIDLKLQFSSGTNWMAGLKSEEIDQLLELKKKLQMHIKWKGAIVENDLEPLVEQVYTNFDSHGEFFKLFELIRYLMDEITQRGLDCNLQHTYGQANGVAHHLSRLGLNNSQVFYNVSEIQDMKTRLWMIDRLEKDKNGYRYSWLEK